MKSRFRENERRCVTCRHWYDPGDAYIQPHRMPGYWEFDTDQYSMCMKTCSKKRAGSYSCPKFESRF